MRRRIGRSEIVKSSLSLIARTVVRGSFLICRMIRSSVRALLLHFAPLPGRSATLPNFWCFSMIFCTAPRLTPNFSAIYRCDWLRLASRTIRFRICIEMLPPTIFPQLPQLQNQSFWSLEVNLRALQFMLSTNKTTKCQNRGVHQRKLHEKKILR